MNSKRILFVLAIIVVTVTFLIFPLLMGPTETEISSSEEATRHPLPPSTPLPAPSSKPMNESGIPPAAPKAPVLLETPRAPWMTDGPLDGQPGLALPQRAESSPTPSLDSLPNVQHDPMLPPQLGQSRQSPMIPSPLDMDDKQLMAELKKARELLTELRNQQGSTAEMINLDAVLDNLKIAEQLGSMLPALNAMQNNPTPEQIQQLGANSEQIMKLAEQFRTDIMIDAPKPDSVK